MPTQGSPGDRLVERTRPPARVDSSRGRFQWQIRRGEHNGRPGVLNCRRSGLRRGGKPDRSQPPLLGEYPTVANGYPSSASQRPSAAVGDGTVQPSANHANNESESNASIRSPTRRTRLIRRGARSRSSSAQSAWRESRYNAPPPPIRGRDVDLPARPRQPPRDQPLGQGRS